MRCLRSYFRRILQRACTMEEFSSPNGILTTERSYFLIFRMNGMESHSGGKGGIKKARLARLYRTGIQWVH